MEKFRGIGADLKSFCYYLSAPQDEDFVKGSVLILHGAEGYGGRYDPFAKELNMHGYAVFAIDHIGHGNTLKDKFTDDGKVERDGLGEWKKEDFKMSASNAYYLIDIMKRKYPGKPVYLIGDDYGGAMAQYMMVEYNGKIDGIIVSSCGLPTSRDARMFLKAWAKKVLLYDGGKSKGGFKSRTRFLNNGFKPARTKYDWMNSVEEEVDRFIEDPLSGYVGTIGYYYYLYKYVMGVPKYMNFNKDYRKDFKKTNKDIPLLLIGGKDDCVTKGGATIEKLKQYYVNKGFSKVKVVLFERARHDLLLEWNKDEVAETIADFIDSNSSTPKYKVKKVEDNEVQTVSVETMAKIANNAVLQEEEPEEDELRLSTKIKD